MSATTMPSTMMPGRLKRSTTTNTPGPLVLSVTSVVSAVAGSISNGIAVRVIRSPRVLSMPMAFRTAASRPSRDFVPSAF